MVELEMHAKEVIFRKYKDPNLKISDVGNDALSLDMDKKFTRLRMCKKTLKTRQVKGKK